MPLLFLSLSFFLLFFVKHFHFLLPLVISLSISLCLLFVSLSSVVHSTSLLQSHWVLHVSLAFVFYFHLHPQLNSRTHFDLPFTAGCLIHLTKWASTFFFSFTRTCFSFFHSVSFFSLFTSSCATHAPHWQLLCWWVWVVSCTSWLEKKRKREKGPQQMVTLRVRRDEKERERERKEWFICPFSRRISLKIPSNWETRASSASSTTQMQYFFSSSSLFSQLFVSGRYTVSHFLKDRLLKDLLALAASAGQKELAIGDQVRKEKRKKEKKKYSRSEQQQEPRWRWWKY